jgi:hypothetical protein
MLGLRVPVKRKVLHLYELVEQLASLGINKLSLPMAVRAASSELLDGEAKREGFAVLIEVLVANVHVADLHLKVVYNRGLQVVEIARLLVLLLLLFLPCEKIGQLEQSLLAGLNARLLLLLILLPVTTEEPCKKEANEPAAFEGPQARTSLGFESQRAGWSETSMGA